MHSVMTRPSHPGLRRPPCVGSHRSSLGHDQHLAAHCIDGHRGQRGCRQSEMCSWVSGPMPEAAGDASPVAEALVPSVDLFTRETSKRQRQYTFIQLYRRLPQSPYVCRNVTSVVHLCHGRKADHGPAPSQDRRMTILTGRLQGSLVNYPKTL